MTEIKMTAEEFIKQQQELHKDDEYPPEYHIVTEEDEEFADFIMDDPSFDLDYE